MISIRCIKSFHLDGDSIPVMKGEMFKLIDHDNMDFEGIEGKSMNPGMVIYFCSKQLLNCFEFVVGS